MEILEILKKYIGVEQSSWCLTLGLSTARDLFISGVFRISRDDQGHSKSKPTDKTRILVEIRPCLPCRNILWYRITQITMSAGHDKVIAPKAHFQLGHAGATEVSAHDLCGWVHCTLVLSGMKSCYDMRSIEQECAQNWQPRTATRAIPERHTL